MILSDFCRTSRSLQSSVYPCTVSHAAPVLLRCQLRICPGTNSITTVMKCSTKQVAGHFDATEDMSAASCLSLAKPIRKLRIKSRCTNWRSTLHWASAHQSSALAGKAARLCALMHTETHSALECCGFVCALYPCLVSCAGSASVWARELMVSRFLYPQGAECCMFRSSCRHFTTLRLCLHSLKLVCCCTRRGPGVRLEAHQIKHLGGCTAFSPNGPNAELGPYVDRNLITSTLPSVSSDALRGTCHQSSFQQVVFAFSIWTEAACSHRCAFMIQ